MDIREAYLAAWNETTRQDRDALLSTHWDSHATYVDPMGEAHGAKAISDLIGAVQDQFSGLVFSPVGDVDAHHTVSRFQWGLGSPGEDPVAVGFDVVTVNDGGLIRSVAGFIDKMPG